MYVDDDPDLQDIVRLGLQTGGGFTVKVCDSGKQALDEVVEFKPDLVILDVVMPEMNGPQTLEALRKIPQAREIPVIFLTSRIRSDQLGQYKPLGVIGLIRKPLNPLKLTEQLMEIWRSG
ncbi:MAG: response regulator [bacterium]|nr:response regulator [bacterium]